MTLGERLKFCRLAREMTQTQLEEITGVSHGTISAYELDKYEPTLFGICCLADALDIPLDFLAGRLTEEEENDVWRRIISKKSARCNHKLMQWLILHEVKK
jgi:transcriptional regulator with XRE-family HTH domain